MEGRNWETKIDMIELSPEMTCGVRYILCVMYNTCTGLLGYYVKRRRTLYSGLCEGRHREGNRDQVSFISDQHANLGFNIYS